MRLDTLQIGGVLTVFPEGSVGAADAQTVLLRLFETDIADGQEAPTPAGYLAYSKLCTHAGCPVGLYQQQAHVLICPCHQAAFDVLADARPRGPCPGCPSASAKTACWSPWTTSPPASGRPTGRWGHE